MCFAAANITARLFACLCFRHFVVRFLQAKVSHAHSDKNPLFMFCFLFLARQVHCRSTAMEGGKLLLRPN